MIVVDTNIIAHMTFFTEHSATVNALHEKNPEWEAPALWKTEFLNVLALYYRKGLISYDDGVEALDLAERLIGPREHEVPARAIVDLLVRSRCSAYDCAFLVLAERLNTMLITYDTKLTDEFPHIARAPEAYLAQFK